MRTRFKLAREIERLSQDQAESSTYAMGYSDEFTQILHRRNAETHAAHLLPYLKSGSRVLDLGCGPGSISVGLARAIEPGELHGIDMEESQIMIARASAAAGGHDNTTFHVGDATALPFEDDSFDAVHTHAVLMHIPDTEGTLNEVKRVLKSGGVLASREMITDASFVGPEGAVDETAWQTFAKLIGARGGHPNMGRNLKNVFVNKGFKDVQAAGSFDLFDSPEDVAFFHAFVNQWFLSDEVAGPATEFGLATAEQFEMWRADMDRWDGHPGAIAAIAFGEAIGFKP